MGFMRAAGGRLAAGQAGGSWRVRGGSRGPTIPKGTACRPSPPPPPHRRLAWSPDGQWLAAANAYDRSTQSNHCRIFRRGEWAADYHCFVGHTAPVVAVRPNPRLFRPPAAGPDGGGTLVARGPAPGGGARAGAVAGSVTGGAGDSPGDADEDPTVVFAICSLDKQFSVWASARARALLVGGGFSKLGVLDAAWTPDGYNLVVASLDGSVVTCRWGVRQFFLGGGRSLGAGGKLVAAAFEPCGRSVAAALCQGHALRAAGRRSALSPRGVSPKSVETNSTDSANPPCLPRFQEDELGRPMDDAAMAAHMEKLYGDPALRCADRPLLEGPEALLMAEANGAAANGARGGAGAAAGAAGRGGGGAPPAALASRVMPQGSAAVTTLVGGKGARGGGLRGAQGCPLWPATLGVQAPRALAVCLHSFCTGARACAVWRVHRSLESACLG